MPGGYANKLYPPVQVFVPVIPPILLKGMLFLRDTNDFMLFLDGETMLFLGA